jgi:basic membrane protein A and related proteins
VSVVRALPGALRRGETEKVLLKTTGTFALTRNEIMKKWNIVGMAAIVAIAAVTFHAYAAEKLKVGFIYVGPVGDLGWTYQHEQGRLEMVKALGDKVETTYLENVPESSDAERSLEQLARAGHKLIFATSFGFMEPTLKVASKYPDVFFEHAVGFKRAKNVSTYFVRSHEADYIEGQIAAKMSKTGTLGFIATFPVPVVIAGINSFMLGAQSVNPNVKLKVVWIGSWFDPTKEADSAKALIDQGADVLTQYTDSPAAISIVEQRGLHAFALASDMIKFGPHAQLTSDLYHWGGYYTQRVKDVLEGKWTSTDTWGGLDSGMLLMAPYTNMPDDVKKTAMETQAAIISGKVHAFKCPVLDQEGKTLECKGGDHLDGGQIRSMNWYVKGVDEKAPK